MLLGRRGWSVLLMAAICGLQVVGGILLALATVIVTGQWGSRLIRALGSGLCPVKRCKKPSAS